MSLERDVNTISQRNRRLDSLAWLIQGDETCGAAYFDGECLLLATNEHEPLFVHQVIKHLKHIATQAALKKSRGEEYIPKVTKKEFESANSEFYVNATKTIRHLTKDQIFTRDFVDALNKITRSIIYSYLRPKSKKAFPLKLSEIIRNNPGKILFPKNRGYPQYKTIHAELKIIQWLIDNNRLFRSGYIGVSKKCCVNCSNAITALNRVLKTSLTERFFDTRGFHDNLYPSAIPAFIYEFTKRPQHRLRGIEAEFCRLSGVNTFQEAFPETPIYGYLGEAQIRSDSPDMTSTIDTATEPSYQVAPPEKKLSYATIATSIFGKPDAKEREVPKYKFQTDTHQTTEKPYAQTNYKQKDPSFFSDGDDEHPDTAISNIHKK